MNENYHMGLNDDHTSIKGNKYLNITQTLDIVSTGGYFHDSGSKSNKNVGWFFQYEISQQSQFFSINPDGGIIIDAGSLL